MVFNKVIATIFATLFVLGTAQAALPADFKLFSGNNDLTGLTNSDFSELCGEPGIVCDSSEGIVGIDGAELEGDIVSLAELRFMPRLKSLLLSDKDMTMLFPTEICTLEHLQYLDLSNNSLVGTIPPCVCNLAYVMYMNLSNNRFQGALPECINGMTTLEGLNLSCNVMDEPLPTSLNYMPSMFQVDYSCNDYKEYQDNITVPDYKAGDVNCNTLCTPQDAVCPDTLYQYGAGTYSAVPPSTDKTEGEEQVKKEDMEHAEAAEENAKEDVK